MRRIVGGGKLFVAGAAVLMAGLVVCTLLAMNALLGHALSPSFSSNAPESAPSAQPAAAPNLQVITPATIAPTPITPATTPITPATATPLLIYAPGASRRTVVSGGTESGSSGSRTGGTSTVNGSHPARPTSEAGEAPWGSVSTSGAPTFVATSAPGSTAAGGVSPRALPAVPMVSTAPGITPPSPSPNPPGAAPAVGPNPNPTSTNTNLDWAPYRHR
ncbi:MAG TPA: hypothetical protein VHA57_02290 [Actinomycetota bacterium]|nr:hypothetical protein [Actinomycetota bacterium]